MTEKYTITNPNLLVEEIDEKYLRMMVNVKGKLKELINTKTTEDLIECCEDRPVPPEPPTPTPSETPIINTEIVYTSDIRKAEMMINTTLGDEITEQHVPDNGTFAVSAQCNIFISTDDEDVFVRYSDNNYSTQSASILDNNINIRVLYNGEYVKRQYLWFSNEEIGGQKQIYSLNGQQQIRAGYYTDDGYCFTGVVNDQNFIIYYNSSHEFYDNGSEIPNGYFFCNQMIPDNIGGYYVAIDILGSNQNIEFDIKVNTEDNIVTINDETNEKPFGLFQNFSDVLGFTNEDGFEIVIHYKEALSAPDMTFADCWNYVTNNTFPIIKIKQNMGGNTNMYYIIYVSAIIENYQNIGNAIVFSFEFGDMTDGVIFAQNYFGFESQMN